MKIRNLVLVLFIGMLCLFIFGCGQNEGDLGVATLTDDFNDGVLDAGWSAFSNGCSVVETDGQIQIQGTTVEEGWGKSSGVKRGTDFPAGNFDVSVDFVSPEFSGPGTKLVYLMANGEASDTVGMFFVPGGSGYRGGYRVQTWNPRQFSSWLPPFGDEDSAYHTMRLVYAADTKILTGYVDDSLVGSVNIEVSGDIAFNFNTSSETENMDIDVCFDNFHAGSVLNDKYPSVEPNPSPEVTEEKKIVFESVGFSDGSKEKYFGKTLYGRGKKIVECSSLDADIYGLYFSAHWCPPCRKFTPVLVDFYNDMKKSDKKLEIIFASLDKSEDAMFEYMEETKMPWFAMEHGCPEVKALSKLYGIRGIPSLVILNSNGEVITKDGRDDVSSLGEKAWDKWIENRRHYRLSP